jgi:hypothetical protein
MVAGGSIKERILWAVLRGAVCLVLCTSTSAFAQNDSGDPAHHIFELTNRDRVARGLQALQWNDALSAAALKHAERMAGESYLSHEYPGEPEVGSRAAEAGAHFQAIAENIATGPNDVAIEQEWMHSTPHRKNILDPQMNSLGVAVVERRGTLYAVEDFDDATEVLSTGQVESRVGALLRREGIEPTAPRGAAEEACLSNSGYPKGWTARLVIRFDTPDLRQLPEQVAGEIRSGNFRKAAVAACRGVKQGSFTTYRVAIVLY